MNSFSFLLLHPDFTIMMLSVTGLHVVPSHCTAFFFPGYADPNLEPHGSGGTLAGIVLCRWGLSLHGVFPDYVHVIKYVLWLQGGKGSIR